MIRGVGVDAACVSEIVRLVREVDGAYVERTYTPAERADTAAHASGDAHYASCWAAKEAVYKAVAHLLPDRDFDLRIVECLNREDGSPFVNVTPALAEVLARAGVTTLHLSLATEGDLAIAFVVATDEEPPCDYA